MKYFLAFFLVWMNQSTENSIAKVSGDKSEWKLEKSKNGIVVYTRKTEASDIKEFQAITTINASKEKIAAILMDVNKYSNWYPNVSESSVIKELNSNELIVFYLLDIPWPATDRDAVLKFKLKEYKEKKRLLISMKSIKGYREKTKDVVRIEGSVGYWQLTSVGNKTKVVYQFLGDPGGKLPTGIINLMIVTGPFNTLTELKKMVDNKKSRE